MSRVAKAFHLTCAIIAALTCALYAVLVGMLVFYWRTVGPKPTPAKFLHFLLPALVIGAGAMMEFSFYNNERQGYTSYEDRSLAEGRSDAGSTDFVLITTRPRALAAIAFTLWMLVQGLRSLSSARPYSLIWLYSGLFPHWAVLPINIVFYATLVWMTVSIVLGRSRKEEKALMFTLFAVPLVAALGVLLPRAASLLRFLQTLLELTALLASISTLLFLSKDRQETPREEQSI